MSNVQVQFYPEKEVGGVKGWYWITTDNGAWDGPKEDWEQSHKEKILKYVENPSQKIVIQAGGNCGMYPKLLSHMFKRVYTFEPDPANFLCLSLNAIEENVIKMQMALGKENGRFVGVNRITMFNVGMHMVDENAPVDYSFVPLTKIDLFGFENVGLLMLDIELYENEALLGALDTIARNKPVIFAENPTNQVVTTLTSVGYKLAEKSKMDGVFIPA